MIKQLTLFNDNPEYDAFVEKFKPKKTTDDCYTPPEVYTAISDYVCEKYGINPATIVRPFYPGGDYEGFTYPEGCVVLDNPPFSILSKICEFYLDRGISFFLFAPSLTCFSGRNVCMRMNHVVCDCDIEYENGAVVRTSFVTSFGGDTIAESDPKLTKIVNNTVATLRRSKVKELPKYSYPDHVVTAAMLQRYARHGISLKIRRGECIQIPRLDAQKSEGKSIFGTGLLLAERAAAERAAAERAAALKWELSDRERGILAQLAL